MRSLSFVSANATIWSKRLAERCKNTKIGGTSLCGRTPMLKNRILICSSSKDQVKIFNGIDMHFQYKVKANEVRLREEPLQLQV